MNDGDLLSDDLATVLRCFPNDALRELVAILKEYTSFSRFPARRAGAAHDLPFEGDFTAHAREIACEILWWGSNDVARQFGSEPSWPQVLRDVARNLRVPADKLEEGPRPGRSRI